MGPMVPPICRSDPVPTRPGVATQPVAFVGPAQSPELEDRAHLDRWCAAVGRPIADIRSHGSVASNDFVVMTWNVAVGEAALVSTVRDVASPMALQAVPGAPLPVPVQAPYAAKNAVPARPPALPKGAGRLGADRRPDTPTEISDVAAALGMSLFYAPSMRNGDNDDPGPAEDRGNAILTRLPMTDLVAIELPFERQRRVAVAATVTLAAADGVPIDIQIVNTHLDNRGRSTDLINASGRERQARGLLQALERYPAPVGLVAGDLNTIASREGALDVLSAAFPRYESVGKPTGPLSFIFTLDHMMFRIPDDWQSCVTRYGDRRGSDHFPLIGRVRIGPSPELLPCPEWPPTEEGT